MEDLNQDDTDIKDEGEYDHEEIPSVTMNKFLGVSCSIHSLALFTTQIHKKNGKT
jgi:hypothetical protein